MPRPRPPPWNLDAKFAADMTARGELQPLLDLIGRFTLWVDPAVAAAVPVVDPKTARITTRKLRRGAVENDPLSNPPERRS